MMVFRAVMGTMIFPRGVVPSLRGCWRRAGTASTAGTQAGTQAGKQAANTPANRRQAGGRMSLLRVQGLERNSAA